MFIPFRAECVKAQSNRAGEKSVRFAGETAIDGAILEKTGKCRGQ
jgi:hypothetical protein